MMGRGALIALLTFTALTPTLGCDPEVSVCELPEHLNTCDGDGDCLLTYCLINCCPCPVAASRRQYDETYCMIDVDDVNDYSVAREYCEEARDQVCEGVSCRDNPCPYFTRAICDDGLCVAGY
jgi:hypothetical protein